MDNLVAMTDSYLRHMSKLLSVYEHCKQQRSTEWCIHIANSREEQKGV